jgi:two-component system sensor histidine kinase YesM
MKLKSPWQGSIFVRLIFTFLAVMVPFLASALLLVHWGIGNIRQEIADSTASKVSFYLNALERELLRTADLQTQFLQDDDISKLSVAASIMSLLDMNLAIKRIETKLQVIHNSNRYVQSVRLFVPLIDRVLYSWGSPAAISNEEFAGVKSSRSGAKAAVYQWNDRLFINLIYPDPLLRREPVFAFSTELSASELKKALNEFTRIENSGAVLFSKSADWSIANGTQPDVAAMVMAEYRRVDKGADSGMDPQTHNLKLGGQTYMAVIAESRLLDINLLVYVPEQSVFGKLHKYQLWFWLLSLIALAVIVSFSYSMYRVIHRPLKEMVRAFRKVENGNLQIEIRHSGGSEFAYLYDQFNTMVQKLAVLVHEVYEKELRAQQAELKRLQSQINPHFLYNSFYMMYRLTKKTGDDILIGFSKHLSDYYQFITRQANDNVALALEIKHIRAYIGIQSTRFYNRITVHFGHVPEPLEQIVVPKLSLQPIVENAFVHGLKNRLEGGEIWISVFQEGESVVIRVEDNGQTLDEAKLDELRQRLNDAGEIAETTGMLNVHRRLRLHFGAGGGITLSRGPAGGLKVDIRIQTEGREQDHAKAAAGR